MRLKTPKESDKKARGVGMHVLNREEMDTRNSEEGSQWSGRDGDKMRDAHAVIQEKESIS